MTSLRLPFFSDEKTSIFSDLFTIRFVFISKLHELKFRFVFISKHIAGVHELKCVYFFPFCVLTISILELK